MIMWAFPVLGCTLLASALLLRRRPLTALAVLLGGSVASMTLQSPVPGSTLQIVAACAAGIELCYIAATRTRRVSVTGVAMAGAGNFLGDQSALSPAQTAGREGSPWRCQRSSLSSLTCGNAHARMRALPRNRRKREKR